MSRFDLQDSQYSEPYHHFVTFDPPGLHKQLGWGLRYFGYVSRVMELAAGATLRNVAEVGCGDGKILLELSRRHPSAQFIGYDLSERSIAFAKAYAWGRDNLSFVAADFAQAAGGYDLILCVETLEHIADDSVALFLDAIRAKLAPGGRVILTVPTANYPVTAKHYRHYTLALLGEQLASRFTIEHYEFVHNPKPRLVRILLTNRIFVLRSAWLSRLLFARYTKKYRQADSATAQHFVAVLR